MIARRQGTSLSTGASREAAVDKCARRQDAYARYLSRGTQAQEFPYFLFGAHAQVPFCLNQYDLLYASLFFFELCHRPTDMFC